MIYITYLITSLHVIPKNRKKAIPKKEINKRPYQKKEKKENKAGYTATPVACGWAGAIFEVSGSFWQEQ